MIFEVVSEENIEQCRGLCNELMEFQKSKATVAPESFDSMNFDTRMLVSYCNALEKQVAIAKVGDVPIGYVLLLLIG